jgi:hypothetical protein
MVSFASLHQLRDFKKALRRDAQNMRWPMPLTLHHAGLVHEERCIQY